jgi:hypothetical protein
MSAHAAIHQHFGEEEDENHTQEVGKDHNELQ